MYFYLANWGQITKNLVEKKSFLLIKFYIEFHNSGSENFDHQRAQARDRTSAPAIADHQKLVHSVSSRQRG